MYALAQARSQLSELLNRHGLEIGPDEVREAEPGMDADLAVPLFRAAKQRGDNPQELAEALAPVVSLVGTVFQGCKPLRGYLNFSFDRPSFSRAVIEDFNRSPDRYGSSAVGAGKTIVIDYSSPNIAKPFSVGHLRSTVIGQALHNVLTWLGYRVIGDNHYGDWGTQFGKLLCAFARWGSEEKLGQNPTSHLLDLYVRFHTRAKASPELEAEARDWFRRLETGEPAVRKTWQRFVDLSLAEFGRIYRRLGVKFEEALGESFYSNRLEELVARALAKDVARHEKPLEPVKTGEDERLAEDETVVLIPLEAHGIKTPLILQKSDGASLYATREIACAEYRIETWHPERILYVVGNEQELYFRQLNAAMKLLGHDTPCIHVSFGLVRLAEGRMSTREGRVILLDDVMSEAVRRARAVVTDREMTEQEKDEVAEIVGIGAIKYADLSQSRVKEVVFDWDRMLALDGDSAPYLLYAHTRCRSILRKAGPDACPSFDIRHSTLDTPEEFTLIRDIARFPDAVQSAATTCEPHRIANHLYRLAQNFSAFYNKVPVLKAETKELAAARLGLVEMTASVLRIGLNLLGIELPERM
jgi:arginyl-tRNA synthetase